MGLFILRKDTKMGIKLFTIRVKHAAPRDSHTAIECFAIANDEDAVYEAVNGLNYERWSDNEDDGIRHEIYDDEYNVIGEEGEKERRLRLRGDIDDEEDWSDAYYGLTWFGWDEGRLISNGEAEALLRLGVAVDWRQSV